PIEPVAPRMVMPRSAGAAIGCDRARPVGVIVSPYQQAARGRIEATARQTEQHADQRSGPKAVQPVHDSAMPRYELARILRAKTALEGGFEQVSCLRNHRKHQSNKDDDDPIGSRDVASQQ